MKLHFIEEEEMIQCLFDGKQRQTDTEGDGVEKNPEEKALYSQD